MHGHHNLQLQVQ
ncbi:hypothetical protein PENNAL_c0833G09221, partial [Penicillium nalgiovense]